MPSTTATMAAVRTQVTSGSHGSATKRSRRSARTSNTRSTNTVASASAFEVPARMLIAPTRARSPARAGSTVLKKWPMRSASESGQRPGRCSATNR